MNNLYAALIVFVVMVVVAIFTTPSAAQPAPADGFRPGRHRPHGRGYYHSRPYHFGYSYPWWYDYGNTDQWAWHAGMMNYPSIPKIDLEPEYIMPCDTC